MQTNGTGTINSDRLVQVEGLRKHFKLGRSVLKAVDGISFEIRRGETLGLVGESGCGKSTTGKLLMRLYDSTEGEILYDGKDLKRVGRGEAKEYNRKLQMIFQDPYASLNPRMVVADIIAEGLDIHSMKSGQERTDRVNELLETVGLSREHANRYPHEFSGGQRQRIGIARALAVEPEFIIADEPVSALDVSIQAQIINLLKRLQAEQGLTYLFISHNLSVVQYVSDRVGVMYLGVLAELADSEALYDEPLHPYTQALLSAIPYPDPDVEQQRERIVLEGDVPNPADPPSGCRFRTRCPEAMDLCARIVPEWREVRKGHWVACHLY